MRPLDHQYGLLIACVAAVLLSSASASQHIMDGDFVCLEHDDPLQPLSHTALEFAKEARVAVVFVRFMDDDFGNECPDWAWCCRMEGWPGCEWEGEAMVGAVYGARERGRVPSLRASEVGHLLLEPDTGGQEPLSLGAMGAFVQEIFCG